MPRILITSTSFGKRVKGPLETLLAKGYDLKFNDLGRPLSPEELIERLADCDGCIAGLDYFTAEVFAAAEKLRIVSRYGSGVDRVDLDAAARAGVTVTNTPVANSDSVADLAVGLMLAVARKIPLADRSVRQGQWKNMYGVSLSGKTVGLLGFGRIGRRVADRVQGFGCRVLVHDPFIDPKTTEQCGVEAATLEKVLAEADFISLHLPANDETRAMINAEKFRLMKPSAILVNTARGETVDQDALLEALRGGRIGGAGLDVHCVEPPDPALFDGMDNVVLTPHMGAYTQESLVNMAAGSVDNLCAFFAGKEPPCVVVKGSR